MKTTTTAISFVALFVTVAAAMAADSLPPKLSLQEALPVAEEYAKSFKDKDLSRYYVGVANLKEASNGALRWEIVWISTNRVTQPNLRPERWAVAVDMQRGCSRLPAPNE